MSIAAIGNSGLNINFTASLQSAAGLGSSSGIGGLGSAAGLTALSGIGSMQGGNGLDPAALGPLVAGAGVIAGTQGNSSVNTVNALATALLIGALSGSEEEDKKKSGSAAGAALALLAYGAIMGLGQNSGVTASTGALTAGAVSAVGFSATA